jgi:hypothetical protein
VAVKPTAEMVNDLVLSGTVIVKAPLSSVITPLPVALIITEAFATGFPAASVTLPVTVRLWALAESAKANTATRLNRNFLISDLVLMLEQSWQRNSLLLKSRQNFI